MVHARDLVAWLKDVDREDVAFVGQKAANLGEMIHADFPVPTGFVITSAAYSQFLQLNKLETKIEHLLNTINYDDPNSIEQVSSHIKNIFAVCPVPEELSSLIFKYYEHMGTNLPVAIRSSATSQNSNAVSFADQHEAYLNVVGDAALIAKVRQAWASLFEAHAIYYRHQNNISHTRIKIALVIQNMIESDVSGIMFTVDPIANNKNVIIIEAIYGLGEYLMHEHGIPDHYEVNKHSSEILHKTVAPQETQLVRGSTGNTEVKVARSLVTKQKITDTEILELAKLARKLEDHYYFPQDCEWAKEKGKLYIVQTRPITTIKEKKTHELEIRNPELGIGHPVLPFLTGDPASPGIGIGQVKIVKSIKDIFRVSRGDVLVAEHTNSEYMPAMRKAAAIVTEKGGSTSHTATVSRELGVPAVVGIAGLLKNVTDGMVLTVNGKTGEVIRGSLKVHEVTKKDTWNQKTNTKIFVTLADPLLAVRAAHEHVDGVGLLYAENLVSDIGIHPKKLLHERRSKEFVDALVSGVAQVCSVMYPRPVLYRAIDFKTHEYAQLTGGREYEPHESNSMLGYRGTFRLITDPKVFELELAAFKQVHKKYNNVQLVLPFVRTVRELEQAKKIIASVGLRPSDAFKLNMMCEVPSNVLLIDEFLEAGIDGVTIGLRDLTMLLLGTDPENEEVARAYDERDPAVLRALERVISACRKKNVEVSVCGQAFSQYPGLVEKLVEWGVSSFSVPVDAIDLTREFVYKAERAQK